MVKIKYNKLSAKIEGLPPAIRILPLINPKMKVAATITFLCGMMYSPSADERDLGSSSSASLMAVPRSSDAAGLGRDPIGQDAVATGASTSSGKIPMTEEDRIKVFGFVGQAYLGREDHGLPGDTVNRAIFSSGLTKEGLPQDSLIKEVKRWWVFGKDMDMLCQEVRRKMMSPGHNPLFPVIPTMIRTNILGQRALGATMSPSRTIDLVVNIPLVHPRIQELGVGSSLLPAIHTIITEEMSQRGIHTSQNGMRIGLSVFSESFFTCLESNQLDTSLPVNIMIESRHSRYSSCDIYIVHPKLEKIIYEGREIRVGYKKIFKFLHPWPRKYDGLFSLDSESTKTYLESRINKYFQSKTINSTIEIKNNKLDRCYYITCHIPYPCISSLPLEYKQLVSSSSSASSSWQGTARSSSLLDEIIEHLLLNGIQEPEPEIDIIYNPRSVSHIMKRQAQAPQRQRGAILDRMQSSFQFVLPNSSVQLSLSQHRKSLSKRLDEQSLSLIQISDELQPDEQLDTVDTDVVHEQSAAPAVLSSSASSSWQLPAGHPTDSVTEESSSVTD